MLCPLVIMTNNVVPDGENFSTIYGDTVSYRHIYVIYRDNYHLKFIIL